MAAETTTIIKDGNGVSRAMKAFDNGDSSYSLVAISKTLSEIKMEEGKYFSAEYNLAMENLEAYELILETAPASALFDFKVAVLANSTFQMYEGCTESGDGTAVEIVNINRVVGGVPTGFTMKVDPTTVSADGTLIVDRTIGTGKDYIATQESSGAFFLLKPSTKYLFRLTSLSNSNKIQFVINLIEG